MNIDICKRPWCQHCRVHHDKTGNPPHLSPCDGALARNEFMVLHGWCEKHETWHGQNIEGLSDGENHLAR